MYLRNPEIRLKAFILNNMPIQFMAHLIAVCIRKCVRFACVTWFPHWKHANSTLFYEKYMSTTSLEWNPNRALAIRTSAGILATFVDLMNAVNFCENFSVNKERMSATVSMQCIHETWCMADIFQLLTNRLPPPTENKLEKWRRKK